MRVAAVQLEARVADVGWNLEASERLADEAGRAGAECIVLPEFFTTGIGFVEELADAALAPDGEATDLLRALASRHGAMVGGSFLCRDADGEVRNAFLLATADGEIAGRHDKDLPTMWENAVYVGGGDAGRIEAGGLRVGVALCWELMRTETVERLAGRVDLVLGGSGWWSIPSWPPRALTAWLEARNERRAVKAPQRFARHVGAPVVHAAHAGSFSCAWPGLGATYRGHYEGGAQVVAADGRIVAFRGREDGEGFAIGEVVAAPAAAVEPPPRFWLQPRGAIAAIAWAYQNPLGRFHYRRHVAPRPGVAADLRRERSEA